MSATMKLFVGNLHPDTTDDDLIQSFKGFGRIVRAKVVRDVKKKDSNRRFGFVTFERADDGDNAIRSMNSATLRDRTITVSEARDQEGNGRVGLRKAKRKDQAELAKLKQEVKSLPSFSNSPVVTSALALLPSNVDAIQALRRKHDRQIERWPPHINFLYPFLPESDFDRVTPILEQFLKRVRPFTITFETFGYFQQPKECVVWLKPEVKERAGVLDKLQGLLRTCLPAFDARLKSRPFSPHLTVGQFPNKAAAEEFIEKTKKTWQPVECRVDSLAIMSRRGKTDPFAVRKTLRLAEDDGAEAPAAQNFDIDTKGLDGSHLPKHPTSHCVINLIPPRSTWGPLQRLRTLSVREQRCGPHFSFVDPFLAPEEAVLKEAAEVISAVLADYPRVTITLRKLNYFVHKGSCTLFVEPECEPAGALNHLAHTLAAVFPQCTDTIDKGHGTFKAHITIGKYPNEAAVKTAKEELEGSFSPITFTLDELYILTRIGGDPFSVAHAVPMSGYKGVPHFGPGSKGSPEATQTWGYSEEEDKIARSLVVTGIPKVWPKDSPAPITDDHIFQLFNDKGFTPEAAEICLNPDGKHRTCAVVQFHSQSDMTRALRNFIDQPYGSAYPLYLNPLAHMTFPGVIGDSCSVKAVKDGRA